MMGLMSQQQLIRIVKMNEKTTTKNRRSARGKTSSSKVVSNQIIEDLQQARRHRDSDYQEKN